MNDYKITHSMAHYLNVIHQLLKTQPRVRLVDVARALNFTKGSTSLALKSLKKKKLIIEHERSLTISPQAHIIVHQMAVFKYLYYLFLRKILQRDNRSAKDESCQIEHCYSLKTSQALFKYLKKEKVNELNDIKSFAQMNKSIEWIEY